MRKKKTYEKLSVSRIQVETVYGILVGSITSMNITVQDVKVEEFAKDSDFPSEGFEVNFD